MFGEKGLYKLNNRYLDIRYSVISDVSVTTNDITFEDLDNNDPICDTVVLNGHAFLKGSRLSTTLDLIKLFILEHPFEFIILKFQQESYQLNTLAKHILIRRLFSTFSNKLINQEDTQEWFDIEKVTLQQLWKHKKNILLLFREEIFTNLGRKKYIENSSDSSQPKSPLNSLESFSKFSEKDRLEMLFYREQLAKKGLFDKRLFISERWHNTDDPELLEQRLHNYFNEKRGMKGRLVVAQTILTNQRGVWKHVKKFYKKGLSSIEKLVYQLHFNENISNFVIEKLYEKRINIGNFFYC